jgi:hypothetical protein
MIQVKVKSLVWTCWNSYSHSAYGMYGEFRVAPASGGNSGYDLRFNTYLVDDRLFDTVEDAKVAAQEWYQDRVMECLEGVS